MHITDYDERRHDGSDAGDDQDSDAALTKKELKYLLTRELGIVMGAEEMRRLVDAFDANKVCC
jgi:Ca2+-binding EF-hand superfamily protein